MKNTTTLINTSWFWFDGIHKARKCTSAHTNSNKYTNSVISLAHKCIEINGNTFCERSVCDCDCVRVCVCAVRVGFAYASHVYCHSFFHNFASQKVLHFIRIIHRVLVWCGVCMFYFIQMNNGFAFKAFAFGVLALLAAQCSLFGMLLCVCVSCYRAPYFTIDKRAINQIC